MIHKHPESSHQNGALGAAEILEGFLLRQDYRGALPWADKLRALIFARLHCVPGVVHVDGHEIRLKRTGEHTFEGRPGKLQIIDHSPKCKTLGDLDLGAQVYLDGQTYVVIETTYSFGPQCIQFIKVRCGKHIQVLLASLQIIPYRQVHIGEFWQLDEREQCHRCASPDGNCPWHKPEQPKRTSSVKTLGELSCCALVIHQGDVRMAHALGLLRMSTPVRFVGAAQGHEIWEVVT